MATCGSTPPMKDRDPNDSRVPLFTEDEIKEVWGNEEFKFGKHIVPAVDYLLKSPRIVIRSSDNIAYTAAVEKAYINPENSDKKTSQAKKKAAANSSGDMQIAMPSQTYKATVEAFVEHLLVDSTGMTTVRRVPKGGIQAVNGATEFEYEEFELGDNKLYWRDFALETDPDAPDYYINKAFMLALIAIAGQKSLFLRDTENKT